MVRFGTDGGPRIDGAILDGVTGPLLESWTAIAQARRIPSYLFVTVGDEARHEEIEASGLGGEAVGGVAGTQGPADGAPTPFGFLFGETNAAIHGVGMLIDRLARGALQADDSDDGEWLAEVSAADACIHVMDTTWSSATMPDHPVHETANPLTNANYQRNGAKRPDLAPYALLETGDGWVCLVGAGADLFDDLGRPELAEDPRLASPERRTANREYTTALLQEWVGTFERGQDLVDLLGNSVVVAVADRLEDIIDDEHGLLALDEVTSPYAITAGGVPVEDLGA